MGQRLTADASDDHIRRIGNASGKRNGDYARGPPRSGSCALDSWHSQRIMEGEHDKGMESRGPGRWTSLCCKARRDIRKSSRQKTGEAVQQVRDDIGCRSRGGEK